MVIGRRSSAAAPARNLKNEETEETRLCTVLGAIVAFVIESFHACTPRIDAERSSIASSGHRHFMNWTKAITSPRSWPSACFLATDV